MSRRIDRVLLGAFLVSALGHLSLVAAPGWELPDADEREPARIEARLVSRADTAAAEAIVEPAPPAPKPKPVRKPKPKPKPKPRPAPEPVPQAPLATLETPPPVPEPVPAEEPAPEPVPPALSEPPAAADASPLPETAETAQDSAQVVEPQEKELAAAVPEDDPADGGFAGEAALPREATIAFSLILGNIQVGEALQTWSRDGHGYRLRIVMETTGAARMFKQLTVIQTSAGGFYAGGLRPRMFTFEQTGRDTSNTIFDWKQMKLTLDRGAKRREFALEPGAQDVLSLAYQLGAVGEAQPGEVAVASGKNFYRNTLEWVGETTVRTYRGEVRTLHVRTTGREQTTEIWLAPDMENLPVRIMFTDRNGTAMQLLAERIEVDGRTLLGGKQEQAQQQ